MRKAFILAAVAALTVPALAQIAPIQMQRPVQLPPVATLPASPGQLDFDAANDPQKAKALIVRLRTKNRALRNQMALTLGDLQALRTQLDEITRAGGSLVRAQCVSDTLSRRTDGSGQEDCSATGYTCSAVEGTCNRQCTSTTQCSAGFVCDTSVSRCVVPPGDDG